MADENKETEFDDDLFQDEFETDDLNDDFEDFPAGGGKSFDEAMNEDEDEKEDQETEEEEKEEDSNELNFEDEEKPAAEEEFTDKDLEAFNKKLNTDFKSSEELKNFLAKDEKAPADQKTDDELIAEAQSTIDLYQGYVSMGDEQLMRERLNAQAVASEKDLNDEDVQIEIEEEIQSMIDSKTISLHAKNLRDSLQVNYIDKAKQAKFNAENNKEQTALKQEAEKKKTYRML